MEPLLNKYTKNAGDIHQRFVCISKGFTMYGLKKNIIDYKRKDYSDKLPDFEYILDCSLGTNPWGYTPQLKFTKELIEGIREYPHTEEEMKRKLIEKYSNEVKLDSSMISLSLGSIGALMTFNRMFLDKGKVIIGVAPQFPAAIDDFNLYEAVYKPVFLRKENNYKFDIGDFIEAVSVNPGAYIYIDNPNNPTGQIIPLSELDMIISKAKEMESFVLIDEAYGDYMDFKDSSVNLINKYDNLGVVRTFSKALGGAGLRLGYAISNVDIMKQYEKVNIPFSMTHISGSLALELMDNDWINYCHDKVVDGKTELLTSLRKLKHGETSVNVPITMLYTDEDDIDLERVMEKAGMKVISCESYEGLEKNAVRVNLNQDMETMIALVKKTEDMI